MLNTKELSIGYVRKGVGNVIQTGLNLDLYESDFICLVGPNGCGKSTLIKTLGGIMSSITGKVYIDGTELDSLRHNERSRYINTVLTDRTTVEHITVEEVVALGRYTYTNWVGTLTERDKMYVYNSIKITGLAGFEERMLSTLSDGERQRVFIAKALASDAPIMLLDEPTAHLDVLNRVEIFTLLRNLSNASGHTCLVSTHDLDLALKLADEIWLMLPTNGIICSTPEEIIQHGYLNKVFSNSSLAFDTSSGSINLRKDFFRKIQLRGHDIIPDYAMRSFERLGLSVSAQGEPLALVGIDDEGWSVVSEEMAMEKLTLPETCRLLKRLISLNK